jgi:hypothetical protein
MNNPVEIETALLGINRPLNRDLTIQNQYQNYNQGFTIEQKSYPVSDMNWTEQSRAICPAWWFREREQEDRYYPPFNPQENVCLPFLSYVDTRIVERDNFKRWETCPRKI